MHKTLLSSWPLFFGVSMIMVGNGLQGTLLGVRAELEGFETYATGMIMSMYFVGYMSGSHFVPKLIRGVGHIRVFAALASIASMTVLFHGLFPNEFVWGIVRAVTGFSYAGLYIVIESWLNNAVNNKTRGKMMALYLVILYGSMAIGQYMLMLADPKGMDLFVIISIFVTIAVLPISLSSRPAPHFPPSAKVPLKALFKISPLGVFGVFCSGMASSCLFSIGPVYAAGEGFTLAEISTFMAAAIIGGVLMQFPIGWCSDRYDRRKVLIVVTGLTAASCFLALITSQISHVALFCSMFMIGGTALTVYGLSSSHTNDHLKPEQTVAASATMILVSGMGSALGPTILSILMDITMPSMLFIMMGTIYGTICVFGLYRTFRSNPVPLDQQSDFLAQPSPSVVMVAQQAVEYAQDSEKQQN